MEREPIRLSRKEAVILRLLASGERYGLELVEASGGELRRGSVYVFLHGLEDRGYVVSRPSPRPDGPGAARRAYRLTGVGAEVLQWWESRPSLPALAGAR